MRRSRGRLEVREAVTVWRPDTRQKRYDGPPGFWRIHEGFCPRAFTLDGQCSCNGKLVPLARRG
jgi:hypothetical protein